MVVDPGEVRPAKLLIVDDSSANRHDLILLDLQMPGIDGFQVIRASTPLSTALAV